MADQQIIHPGPRNESLLYAQKYHVSNKVWNEEEDRILNMRKPKNFERAIPPQIESRLRRAGFYEVALVRSKTLDKELISALVERWRPETHTFHMPFGECTITLQDVAMLLGLNIEGAPVTGVTWNNWSEYVTVLFGAPPPPGSIKGSSMKLVDILNMMDDIDIDNLDNDDDDVEEALDCYARMFIMLLIGSFLFVDHTGSLVPLRYLLLLTDFDTIGSYSWGSAVLAYLYREMCNATDPKRKEIGGCTYLIQMWAWLRIPGIGPQNPALLHIVEHPLATRYALIYLFKYLLLSFI